MNGPGPASWCTWTSRSWPASGDGGGRRAHGRAAREATRDRASKIGYDYVHSLVDDHSRLAYSELLPEEKGTTCAAFLAGAAAYFADYGIDRRERVMTDNAWAYRWSICEVITALGARQEFIKPHCPWQNGKVERLNRTLATEWPTGRPAPATPSAQPLLFRGSSTTTLSAATAHSAATLRSAT